jgi:hypothetical protein
MKIGDKVRFTHGKEEGRIVNVIDSKQVEVEIEDGFRIPALKSELVVVAVEESHIVMGVEEGDITGGSSVWNGIYIAFTPFNDQIYELSLVNDTGYKIYFVIGEEKESIYKGVFSGVVEKDAYIKLNEVNVKDFDNWPELVIQLIFFSYGESVFRPPLLKKQRFRSSTFFKSKKLAPVLNKEAYLFRIDQDAIRIDAKVLEENMSESKSIGDSKSFIAKPSKEIDLHIEKLTDKHIGMSNSAMLSLQLTTFQNNLDNAMATGMEEIIFIHGVGNGVLKKEIHKALSSNKNIKFFQDAQKEKFGYGATLVRLK